MSDVASSSLYLVDPIVYLVPNADDSHISPDEFLQILLIWSDYFREKPSPFFTSNACNLAMYEAGCYPEYPTLSRLLTHSEIHWTDSKVIFSVCSGLLKNFPFLEDRCPQLYLNSRSVNPENFYIRPDLLDRLPVQVAEEFLGALGRLALVREQNSELCDSDVQLVTHPCEMAEAAKIEAHVDSNHGDIKIQSTVPLITHPRDIEDALGVNKLWPNIDRIIKYYYRRMVNENVFQKDLTLLRFVVADSFVRSIEDHHLLKRPETFDRIMKEIVKLLVGIRALNTVDNHILTEVKHGPQIVSGKWGAWRMHLTARKAGWRLHYWHWQNEFILMHVNPHEVRKNNIDPPSFN